MRETQSGVGLFRAASLGSGYDQVGRVDVRESQLNGSIRGTWRALLKFTPSGDTLLDAILETLGTQSHPDGLLGPRPIMPDSQRQMRLLVPGAGPKPVYSKTFRCGDDPEWGRVQDVLQMVCGEALDQDETHGRKVLGGVRRLLRQSNLDLFLPTRHKGTRDLSPATTLTDDFDRTNSNDINTGSSVGWTEVSGDHFEIIGNKLEDKTGSDAQTYARAETDLSKLNHYCQALVTEENVSSAFVRVCTRFSLSAADFYTGGVSALSDLSRILKFVTGSPTALLDSDTIAIGAETGTIKLESDGSTQTLDWTPASSTTYRIGITDTTHPGGTRCGVNSFRLASGFNQKWDDWEAADIGPGPGGPMFDPGMTGGLNG